MPAPTRSRPLTPTSFSATFPRQKPTLFTESARPSSLAPHIRHLAWSPTGAALATTSTSKIRIWNPDRAAAKSSHELLGHTGTVERVAWNPGRESELASTGSDGSLKLWDVRVGGGSSGGSKSGGASVADVKIGDSGLFLAWHPSGRELVVGRRDDVLVGVDVRMLNGATGTTMTDGNERLLPRPGKRLGVGQTNQVVFSNSGREMFATTGEGAVKVVDWPSMTLLHTLHAHTSAAYSVAYSPLGTYLAVGGGDSLVTLWDTHDWVCKATLAVMTGGVHCLSFSFDGIYLVGAHGPDKEGEKGIEIACAQTGEYVCSVETGGVVNVAEWHPARYWLAYAGDVGGVKVVGMAGGL